MIKLDIIWALILGEWLLVSSLGLLGLSLFLMIKRGRDRRMVKGFARQVQENEDRRMQEITRVLGDRCGLSGDPLNKQSRDLRNLEKRIYQRSFSSYLLRNPVNLMNLNMDVEALVSAYWSLLSGGAAGVAEAAPADDGELQALRSENRQLQEELRITMETMSRMLDDYSSVFSGGATAEASGAPDLDELLAQEDDQQQATEPADPAEAGEQAEELMSLDDVLDDGAQEEASLDDIDDILAETQSSQLHNRYQEGQKGTEVPADAEDDLLEDDEFEELEGFDETVMMDVDDVLAEASKKNG